MNNIVKFLQERRSITAKKMEAGEVLAEHLENIIKCGLRVPDHGALSPWKITIVKGEALKKFGEQVLLPEFLKAQENPNPSLAELEKSRFSRASVVLIVMSTPPRGVKIPTWEMHLSAGAVCQNLLLAAQSYSYAAQWLTEWYSYSENVISALGGDPTKDKIAGCIYIGTKLTEPTERKRPLYDESVSELEL